jgi:tellurite resistance protein TerC
MPEGMPTWFGVGALVVIVALLIGDLVIVSRRPREPSMREATMWVFFYVGLAIIFGICIIAISGPRLGGEFFAGWLTEYSLSIDNLFVFIIIMSRFAVPREYQQKVLMIGIVLALILRGICIALGAAAIERFSWVFYLFGAFLVYTAIHLAASGPEDEREFRENVILRWSRRVLPTTPTYRGGAVVVKEAGRRLVTPMLTVMIAIGTTDLLFALDSIPAIFGLTKEPYLVFTANVFALMGLRQLYFLIGGLLERLVYLSFGLAVVLGFIGVKLILEALHLNEVPFINNGEHVSWAPEIPIWLSLTVIVVTLLTTAVLSLMRTGYQARARRRRGVPRPPSAPVWDPRDERPPGRVEES